MKWRSGRRSSNIEDRRGRSPAAAGRGVKMGGGIGGIGLLVLLAVFLTGGNPMQLIGDLLGGGGSTQPQAGVDNTARQAPRQRGGRDDTGDFVSAVLADTEDTWTMIFNQAGARYAAPTLVLFEDAVNSACGRNTAASGPFYCPGDHKLYLDTSFFVQLQRMGAPGDFAQAYVIAHEVAHHVQNLQGISMKVQQAQRRAAKEQANQLSVLTELQADCYAGIWAHYAQRQGDLLEPGDLEEGLRAAASIGDDNIQRQSGRGVRPESFTHGSSAQRMHWFKMGLANGQVGRCDTFAAAQDRSF